jgi:cyclase
MPTKDFVPGGFFLALAGVLLSTMPVLAQIDFSGEWTTRVHEDYPERIPGPMLGDYLGLPINMAARAKADAWDASIQAMPEWQCRPHSADYIWRGPSTLRIWKEVDTVTRDLVAFHAEWLRSVDRPIYLDGRPHPPPWAAHTWGGFSTGRWDGDILTIRTTHLKEGYLRRNGVARSDRATMMEHWIRHGDVLTVVTIVEDPVWLSEPFIRTTNFVPDLHQQIPPYPCEMVQEVKRDKGVVPHHLPGTNTGIKEVLDYYKIPEEAFRGGPETTRPEYQQKLKTMAARMAAALPEDQSPRVAQRTPQPGDGGVHALRVRGNIYMLIGAGGNITLKAAENGVVLLVDSGHAGMADKVLAAIRQITPRPIRKIINTSLSPDHTGGNAILAETGSTPVNPTHVGDLDLDDASVGAAILAHEKAFLRMAAPEANKLPALPFRGLPTETFFNDEYKLSERFNGEAMHVIHVPSAHTDGDSIVWFRQTDVISTGDVFSMTGYPMIDLARGGSLQGIIDALNKILDLAIPAFRSEGGTMIIPGHGRICDFADVAFYRDMVTIIRDRIQDMIRKGMTLEQVQVARPTFEYDGLYGAISSGANSANGNVWTTNMFVEAAYKSLSPAK